MERKRRALRGVREALKQDTKCEGDRRQKRRGERCTDSSQSIDPLSVASPVMERATAMNRAKEANELSESPRVGYSAKERPAPMIRGVTMPHMEIQAAVLAP